MFTPPTAQNIVYMLIAGPFSTWPPIAGAALTWLGSRWPSRLHRDCVGGGVVSSYRRCTKGNLGLLAAGVACRRCRCDPDGRLTESLVSAGRTVSKKSIVPGIVSGVLMGSGPFVTRAMTHRKSARTYKRRRVPHPGALLSCLIRNVLLHEERVGEPVSFSATSAGRLSGHVLVCCADSSGAWHGFQLVAGQLYRRGISYAIGQSAPMVAALWGVLAWKEFNGSGSRLKYFWFMFVFYALRPAVAMPTDSLKSDLARPTRMPLGSTDRRQFLEAIATVGA